MKTEITQAELVENLSYDPDSGVFRRKISNTRAVKAGDIAGSQNGKGYLTMMVCGRVYKAHRLAFLYMTGSFPPEEVDHINGIRDDNRWANLRAVSHVENSKNQKTPKSNTSGHIGVFWSSREQRWVSWVRIFGKTRYVGKFKDKDDAIQARLKANEQYGFHPNHGRVPQ